MSFPEEAFPTDRTEQVRMTLRLFQQLNRECELAVQVVDAGGDRDVFRRLYVTCGNLELQISRSLEIMTVAEFGAIAEEVSTAIATRTWATVQPALVAVRAAAQAIRTQFASPAGLAALFTPSGITDNGQLLFQTPFTPAQDTQFRALLAAVTDNFTS